MSHFTVTCIVSKDRLSKHGDDLDAALEELLAPYQENNMGDAPKEFLEFNDTEEEMLEEYQTGTRKVPDGIPKLEIPFKDLYTFEGFAKAWHGRDERDPEKNRYGYWENPNKKWDWYKIGGRWTGKYPVKPGVKARVGERGLYNRAPKEGYADVVRKVDLDMDKIMSDALTEVNTFWTEYQDMLAGKKFDAFDGPRSTALDIGLLYVEHDVKAPVKDGFRSLGAWRDTTSVKDDRQDWRDVVREISKEDFIAKYFMCFNPVKTFAALDDRGWHAPGEMGWFGCHDAQGEGVVEYANGFMDFIKAASDDDLIVCVDCHI